MSDYELEGELRGCERENDRLSEEIRQLRTELAAADERAQGHAERCTAAIQLADARRAIDQADIDTSETEWKVLNDAEDAALGLWEDVR